MRKYAWNDARFILMQWTHLFCNHHKRHNKGAILIAQLWPLCCNCYFDTFYFVHIRAGQKLKKTGKYFHKPSLTQRMLKESYRKLSKIKENMFTFLFTKDTSAFWSWLRTLPSRLPSLLP